MLISLGPLIVLCSLSVATPSYSPLLFGAGALAFGLQAG